MLAIQTDFLRLTHDETCIVLVWAVGIILINLFAYFTISRDASLDTLEKKDKMLSYSVGAMVWPIILAAVVTLAGMFIIPYLVAVLPSQVLFKEKSGEN